MELKKTRSLKTGLEDQMENLADSLLKAAEQVFGERAIEEIQTSADE